MIKRTQLYKLGEASVSGGGRERVGRALARALSELSGPLGVEVLLPADAASLKSWDLSLVLGFEDLGAAEACLSSPAYRDALDGALGRSIVVEKGWSFALLAT
jgi:hypothetical protein